MVALTNLLDLAFVAVLLPVWAAMTTGSAGDRRPGVLATFGAAAAVGSICAAAWADRLPRYPDLPDRLPGVRSTAVRGVFALDVSIWPVLAVCVASGFASGFLNPIPGAVSTSGSRSR